MNGPELLKALLAAAGDNPYRVATRLKNPPLQSYASKFIAGKVKEPRRDSLRPLAEYYRVPLEAFYDPALADQVAAERHLAPGATRLTRAGSSAPTSELANALDVLFAALRDVDKSTRIAVAPLLAAMATDPAEAKNQSELLLRLLVSERDKSHKAPQDRMREPHIFEDLGVLDLGDGNGRSNTDTATGSGRKK
jgi:hypothetical protein